MFKNLFKKKEREPQAKSALLFVLLSKAEAPDFDLVHDELQKTHQVKADRGEKGVALFEVDGGSVAMAYMPAPVPGNEAAEQIPFSRFWEADASPDHQSHVVVFGSFPDINRGTEMVAQVARAITATHDVAAWYCGNASHILNPETASEIVESGASLPIWVNVVMTQNPNGSLDASTIGMEALGHREFEIVGSRQPGPEIYELLMDTAAYVLHQGPVLLDGQTFGRTMEERFKIEVGRSKLGKEGKVIRLNWM